MSASTQGRVRSGRVARGRVEIHYAIGNLSWGDDPRILFARRYSRDDFYGRLFWGWVNLRRCVISIRVAR